MNELRGFDRVMKVLDTTKDKTARKMAKSGINAALMELSKAIRKGVNSAPLSPEMKRAVRTTIAKRLKKKENQPYQGKAGFGVGKQSKKKREKATARAGDKSRRGVGIAAANIHWPVFGTQERSAGGHPTGKMPALLLGIVKQAAAASGPAMLEAARKKVSTVLATEVARTK